MLWLVWIIMSNLMKEEEEKWNFVALALAVPYVLLWGFFMRLSFVIDTVRFINFIYC